MSETVFSVPVFGGSITGRWNQNNSSFIGIWTDSLRTGDYHSCKDYCVKEPITSKCVETADRLEWNTTEGRLVADVVVNWATPLGRL